MITRKLSYKLLTFAEQLIRPGAREASAILKRSDSLGGLAFRAWRDRAFRELITHSYNTVPYYRSTMDELGLKPENFNTIKDIYKLPLLTKDIIRKEGDRLKSSTYEQKKLIISKSGGTTGEPIESLLDEREYYLEAYAYQRGLKWMGWKPGMGTVKLFGGSLGLPSKRSWISRLRDYALGVLFVPAFEIDKNNIKYYWEQIARNGENIIIGYSSAIYNIACFAESSLLPDEINRGNIQCAFFTAEAMDPRWADKIREVLKCDVRGFYGCGEINSLGFQVDNKEASYLIPSDHVILESVNHYGIENHLAATPLFNYAKPLIRYLNGDIGEVEPVSNTGRHPKIIDFGGRSADMFLKANGNRISSILGTHSILKTGLPVKKYQYIQKEIDVVEMRYQIEEGKNLSSSQKAEVERIFEDHLGQKLRMKFVRTEDFIVTKNGKHRIMISYV